MIISFSWTTPALLAGAKTVTRRQWKDSHAAKFKKGDQVDAYDRLPRVGGKPVGTIRIQRDPYREPICLMPDTDYFNEGFEYMYLHQELIPQNSPFKTASWKEFCEWRESGGTYWVLCFYLVNVLTYVDQLPRESSATAENHPLNRPSAGQTQARGY